MLKFTLIMLEGQPVTEIYLSELVKADMIPEKIVVIKPKSILQGSKGRLIGKFFGDQLSSVLYYRYKNWQNRRKQKYIQKILRHIIPENEFNCSELKGVTSTLHSRIMTVKAGDINDSEIKAFLEANIRGAILTAGTGIIKKNILSIPEIKFINVHSGIVPKYKGSDNFFYALINNETPGCSIFYMDQGVDTGDVLFQCETPINFANKDLHRFDRTMIFKAIKSYVIPYLKIKSFISFMETFPELHSSTDLSNLPTQNQSTDEGRTYFRLHPEMRKLVIDRIIFSKCSEKDKV